MQQSKSKSTSNLCSSFPFCTDHSSSQFKQPLPVPQPYDQGYSTNYKTRSTLYQTSLIQNLHNSNNENALYDSTYSKGYPKLYGFDTSNPQIRDTKANQLYSNEKSKYSFRRNLSKDQSVVKNTPTQNTVLLVENQAYALRTQIQRLIQLLYLKDTEISRISSIEQEISRLNQLLIIKDSQISRLSIIVQQRSTQQRVVQKIVEKIVYVQNQQPAIQPVITKVPIVPVTIIDDSRQRQIFQREKQEIYSKFQSEIIQLKSLNEQYSLKVSKLQIQLNQSSEEIRQMKIVNKQSQQKPAQNIVESKKQSPKPSSSQVSSLQQRIEEYNIQIQRLRSQISSYKQQLSSYEYQFQQYHEQISILQQKAYQYKKQQQNQVERYHEQIDQQGQGNAENTQRWLVQQGKYSLKIIILMEQINRLRQKQQDLLKKAEELHAYLLKAENYIEEIQAELQKHNLKEIVPPHIVQKIVRLEQENAKYSTLNQQLQQKLTQIKSQFQTQSQTQSETQKSIKSQEILKAELQKLSLQLNNQLNVVSQQNIRLNKLLQNYISQNKYLKTQLINREQIYIKRVKNPQPQIQKSPATSISEQFSKSYAKLSLKTIILLEQINRLNVSLRNQHNFLVNAENYIYEMEQKSQQQIIQTKTITNNIVKEVQKVVVKEVQKVVVKEVFKTPLQVQQQLRILIQEKQRLQLLVSELKQRSSRVQTKVQTKIETKIVYETPENIEQELAKLALKSIILLEQIKRLNTVNKDIFTSLVNAENYIEECQVKVTNLLAQVNSKSQVTVTNISLPGDLLQISNLNQQIDRLQRLIIELQNRPAKVEQKVEYKVPEDIQTKLRLLTQENQTLRVQIQKKSKNSQSDQLIVQNAKYRFRSLILLQQINRINAYAEELKGFLINAENHIYELENTPAESSVNTQLTDQLTILRSQNRKYQIQIQQFNVQISNYRNEVDIYKSKISHLQSSSSLPVQLQKKVILLESQNQRLSIQLQNLKTSLLAIDNERLQVIQHLINAQNFIQQLEQKSRSTQSMTSTTITVGSFEQVAEFQTQRRIEIAARDLRIIFLLEEISRLNQKQQYFIEQLNNTGLSHQQLHDLRAEREQNSRQTQEILAHLRNAQTYIQQLSQRYEQLNIERNELAQQLNSYSRR